MSNGLSITSRITNRSLIFTLTLNFAEAIEQNDYDRLNELLVESRPCKPKEATAALQRAILKKTDDSAPCIQLLLSKHADPNSTDGRGTPFVVLAADSGCTATVKLLLDAGADPNKPRLSDNSTALHRAVWNNHVACVDALLGAGAKTEKLDSQGRTPLIVASQNDRTESMVSLLNYKSNVKVRDAKDRTALYWAARLGNTAIANLIVSIDQDIIDVSDVRGNTPLIMATERGFQKIVELLINAKADVDICNDIGDTALLIAAKAGHRECLQLLLEAEADVDVVNKSGTNPLFHCMTDASSLSDILEAGADPDVKMTADGKTVLALLSARDFPVCLKLLLEANAEFEEAVGHTDPKCPLQFAIEHGQMLNSQLLFTCYVSMGRDLTWLSKLIAGASIGTLASQYRSIREIIAWLEKRIPIYQNVPKLMTLCRKSIRIVLGGEFFVQKVSYLPLPATLQKFILMPELNDVFQGSE